MKNGNMPAMPITSNLLASSLELDASSSKGMTKREMIAMHVLSAIAAEGDYEECVYKKAKLATCYADALLKELEKQQ